MIYNLALLPDLQTRYALEKYSQALAQELPGPYVLGINSLPHITVLQFTTNEEIEGIWAMIAAKSLILPVLNFKGFYVDPWNDHIWFGIRAGLTDELIEVQAAPYDLVRPETLMNKLGAGYFPHATLGCTEIRAHLPTLPFAADLVARENIACTLALGVSGPSFQFETILFE